MTLIEEIKVTNSIVKFFHGMDIDLLISHPKDGSEGFIFCFINNYKSEILKYDRENKIRCLTDGTDVIKFEWSMIENDYISIYQTEGIDEQTVYNTIKNKVLNNQFPNMPWVPISGISKGAWKIT